MVEFIRGKKDQQVIKPGNLAKVKKGTCLYERLPRVLGDVMLEFDEQVVTIVSTHLCPVKQDEPVWSYVLWSNKGSIKLGWIVTSQLSRVR